MGGNCWKMGKLLTGKEDIWGTSILRRGSLCERFFVGTWEREMMENGKVLGRERTNRSFSI